jgi:predicted DsbA family dithiol-disulfide isomerase
MGVTGVPCFIIDMQYAVVGAQSAEALADAMRKIVQEKARQTAETSN